MSVDQPELFRIEAPWLSTTLAVFPERLFVPKRGRDFRLTKMVKSTAG